MLYLIKKLNLWWPRIFVFLLPSYFVFYKALVSFYEVTECYMAYCKHWEMLWGWGRVFMLIYGLFSVAPQLIFCLFLTLSHARIDEQSDWSDKKKRNEKGFRVAAFVWSFLLPLIMLFAHEFVMLLLFFVNKIMVFIL